MDELLLKQTMEKLNIKERYENEYSPEDTTDLLIQSQHALKNASIDFKKIPKKSVYKKSYFLRLFNDNQKPFLDFSKGFYPNNTGIGKIISNDKLLTEQFLSYAGVKTPITKFFKPSEYAKAVKYVSSQEVKCVLKPKDLRQSLGAFRDVDVTNLESTWKKNLKIQKQYNVKKPLIIIQNQVEGLELRVTVIEGKADTATLRAPGYIVGDGNSTIEYLINEKNEKRKKNNFHYKNPYKFNEALEIGLKSRNLTLDSILADDEYLILYPKVGIATGRDNIEISEFINPNIFKQAEDAVTAIPNVHTAGVDVMISNLDATEGTVLEVNQNPAFQVNYFNMYGSKQDPLATLFSNLKLEDKILNEEVALDDFSKDELNAIIERYKFLYRKQSVLSDSIKQMISQKGTSL
ncbi:ATP-grasp domain-containing protein [Jeotgalicoccus huakuii]|nr:ATP-grasp domain-containing protein [Jeotgalicoccus huakuii]